MNYLKSITFNVTVPPTTLSFTDYIPSKQTLKIMALASAIFAGLVCLTVTLKLSLPLLILPIAFISWGISKIYFSILTRETPLASLDVTLQNIKNGIFENLNLGFAAKYDHSFKIFLKLQWDGKKVDQCFIVKRNVDKCLDIQLIEPELEFSLSDLKRELQHQGAKKAAAHWLIIMRNSSGEFYFVDRTQNFKNGCNGCSFKDGRSDSTDISSLTKLIGITAPQLDKNNEFI